jgi:hypothetical protein
MSVYELPPPLAMEPDGLDGDAVEPVLEPGEALGAVEPVLEGGVAPAVEPVEDAVLPGEVAEGFVLEPVLDPVIDPVEEPMLPAPLLETLAPVSMKLPPADAELPVVPVAPVVPVLDAVLPAPDPDTRQPVTTTVLLALLLVLPVWSGVPVAVCAAAPAPSATAIIVPKRNCRFITSSVLG